MIPAAWANFNRILTEKDMGARHFRRGRQSLKDRVNLLTHSPPEVQNGNKLPWSSQEQSIWAPPDKAPPARFFHRRERKDRREALEVRTFYL